MVSLDTYLGLGIDPTGDGKSTGIPPNPRLGSQTMIYSGHTWLDPLAHENHVFQVVKTSDSMGQTISRSTDSMTSMTSTCRDRRGRPGRSSDFEGSDHENDHFWTVFGPLFGGS